MPKTCGDCGLCCKLPRLTVLAAEGEWCPHAESHGGCKIYKDRPQTCRKYECLWLQTEVLGEDLKPSRCGILFEPHFMSRVIVAMVDDGYLWNVGPHRPLVQQMLQDGYIVWVLERKARNLLLPAGINEAEAHRRTLDAWRKKLEWPHQVTRQT